MTNRLERSDRNEDIVTLRRSGAQLEEIGTLYGITRERVRQICVRHEKQTGENLGHQVEVPIGALVRMSKDGKTVSEIATAIGRSPGWVSITCRKLGIPIKHSGKIFRDRNAPRRKALRRQQVDALCRLAPQYEHQVPYLAIATECGKTFTGQRTTIAMLWIAQVWSGRPPDKTTLSYRERCARLYRAAGVEQPQLRAPRPWMRGSRTPDRDAVIQTLWREGLSAKAIAQQIGCAVHVVYRVSKLRSNGVESE